MLLPLVKATKSVGGGFLLRAIFRRDEVKDFERYPFSIPSVRHLAKLEFHSALTYIVGENGSGKSTLIEAIAVAAGFNAEGGSKNFNFSTAESESCLADHLTLVRGGQSRKRRVLPEGRELF